MGGNRIRSPRALELKLRSVHTPTLIPDPALRVAAR